MMNRTTIDSMSPLDGSFDWAVRLIIKTDLLFLLPAGIFAFVTLWGNTMLIG
ncbi:MAG: hypothetical protein PHW40_02400 [Candidatus Izemoplasmatales bacterium]|nr:hypothetical protein [Candidatus Izemoplasmatales bacterium]MDD5293147.1 hypothetical protein [Candidatus Izemoplasmatales bacterium]